jgi:hypothetical protein
MKSIIAGIVLLVIYIIFQVYIFNRDDYFGGNYDSALNVIESADEKLNETIKFLYPHINIKTRKDLDNAIAADTVYSEFLRSHIQVVDNDFAYHHNLIFKFDSTGHVSNISLEKMHPDSWLDDSKENYKPILSYFLQHDNYDNIDWGRLHPVWILVLLIIGTILIINLVFAIVKNDSKTYLNVVVLAGIGIVINLIHLSCNTMYQLYNETDTFVQIGKLPSSKSLIKMMGISSQYNALIIETSILFLLVILFSAFILRRNIRKEV